MTIKQLTALQGAEMLLASAFGDVLVEADVDHVYNDGLICLGIFDPDRTKPAQLQLVKDAA